MTICSVTLDAVNGVSGVGGLLYTIDQVAFNVYSNALICNATYNTMVVL